MRRRVVVVGRTPPVAVLKAANGSVEIVYTGCDTPEIVRVEAVASQDSSIDDDTLEDLTGGKVRFQNEYTSAEDFKKKTSCGRRPVAWPGNGPRHRLLCPSAQLVLMGAVGTQ